ncbi:ATP-binding cassette domain-containing protein [Arthrobacter echini]|uniref:ATP-binding cassette domain-containing protein n=1 Tax=Arthrobacter echini TaxID=1529066 RepID=A0A4S5E043_9MICC|nr:ATP-binding cassette domain-containing protein [Arthrobacter echini]THJ64612.1 ATP-binding cassette domain-containing protein [Arthrobacter echini]
MFPHPMFDRLSLQRRTPMSRCTTAVLPALLIVDGISKRYGQRGVRDISFTISTGTVLALVGPPGSGKTTIVRMIAGITRPDSGSITVDGKPFATVTAPAHTMGLFLSAALIPKDLPALSYLQYVAQTQGIDRARCTAVLHQVGLTPREGRHQVQALPWAQRHRLGIAAALLARPRLLVLDDPVPNLFKAGTEWVTSLIHSLAEDGVGILISSRQEHVLCPVADHLVALDDGVVITQGPSGDYPGAPS